MIIENKYLKSDTLSEIVYRNKENIINLYKHLNPQFKKIFDDIDFINQIQKLHTTEISDNKKNILVNTNTIQLHSSLLEEDHKNIQKNKSDIKTLMLMGRYRGRYASVADINKITDPKDGDYAELGTKSPYIIYVYTNKKWDETGISHDGEFLPVDYTAQAIMNIKDDLSSDVIVDPITTFIENIGKSSNLNFITLNAIKPWLQKIKDIQKNEDEYNQAFSQQVSYYKNSSYQTDDLKNFKNYSNDPIMRESSVIEKIKESSGSGETWNDITNTYKTRKWTVKDNGKKMRLSYANNNKIFCSISQNIKDEFRFSAISSYTDPSAINTIYIVYESYFKKFFETNMDILISNRTIGNINRREIKIDKLEIFE